MSCHLPGKTGLVTRMACKLLIHLFIHSSFSNNSFFYLPLITTILSHINIHKKPTMFILGGNTCSRRDTHLMESGLFRLSQIRELYTSMLHDYCTLKYF